MLLDLLYYNCVNQNCYHTLVATYKDFSTDIMNYQLHTYPQEFQKASLLKDGKPLSVFPIPLKIIFVISFSLLSKLK